MNPIKRINPPNYPHPIILFTIHSVKANATTTTYFSQSSFEVRLVCKTERVFKKFEKALSLINV